MAANFSAIMMLIIAGAALLIGPVASLGFALVILLGL